MSACDQILIDPAADDIRGGLRAAVEQINERRRGGAFVLAPPLVTAGLAGYARQAEGCALWCESEEPGQRSTDALFAWWPDAVGRRHVRLAVRRREPYLELWSARLVPPGTSRPAPWLLYPDRIHLVQQPDGPLELVAVCHCGAAGPLERLGWMGPSCGPCHDRGLDGLASSPPPAVLRGPDQAVRRACFGPGADRLTSLCGYVKTGPAPAYSAALRSSEAGVFDLATGAYTTLQEFVPDQHTTTALASSPARDEVAVALANRVTLFPGPGGPVGGEVRRLELTPAGQLAAVLHNRVAILQPSAVGLGWEDRWSARLADGRSLAVAPDGAWLAVAQAERLALLRPDPGRIDTYGVPGWRGVRDVAVAPDGRTVALALEGRAGWNRPGGVRTFEVATRAFGAVDGLHPQPTACVTFSPDGRFVLSGGTDRAVRVWDRATGRAVCSLLWHLGAVQSFSWSGDGETLATGSSDGTIKLWPWRALVKP